METSAQRARETMVAMETMGTMRTLEAVRMMPMRASEAKEPTRAVTPQLQLEERVLYRMLSFAFARFAKVVIFANSALVASAFDGCDTAAIALDVVVHVTPFPLLELQQTMLSRMYILSLARLAQVVVRAHGAFEAHADNRVHPTAITPDPLMDYVRLLGRLSPVDLDLAFLRLGLGFGKRSLDLLLLRMSQRWRRA